MDNSTYKELRGALDEEGLLGHNYTIGKFVIVGDIAAFALFLTVSLSVEKFSVLYWLTQLLLGFSMMRFFLNLHECGHGIMFRHKTTNTVVGFICSLFCLMPYIPWRNYHRLHHKWSGIVDKDPVAHKLIEIKFAGKTIQRMFNFVWKYHLPVPAMGVIFGVFWKYPWSEFRRGKPARVIVKGIASVVLVASPHLMTIVVFGIGTYCYSILPATLFYLWWFDAVQFAHHAGKFPYESKSHPKPVPLREQVALTRSTPLHPVLSGLLIGNFNYHAEHHLFPWVSWYNLPKVSSKLKQVAPHEYEHVPLFGFMKKLRAEKGMTVHTSCLPPLDDYNPQNVK